MDISLTQQALPPDVRQTRSVLLARSAPLHAMRVLPMSTRTAVLHVSWWLAKPPALTPTAMACPMIRLAAITRTSMPSLKVHLMFPAPVVLRARPPSAAPQADHVGPQPDTPTPRRARHAIPTRQVFLPQCLCTCTACRSATSSTVTASIRRVFDTGIHGRVGTVQQAEVHSAATTIAA